MAEEEKARKVGRSRLKTALILLMVAGIGAGLMFAYFNWKQGKKAGISTIEVTPTQTPISAPTSVDSQLDERFCRDRWVAGPCAPARWEQVRDISGQLYAHYRILVPVMEPGRVLITDKILVSSLADGKIASQELLELNGEQAWDFGVRDLPGLGRVHLWVLMACGNPAWKPIAPAPTATPVSPVTEIHIYQEQKQSQTVEIKQEQEQIPTPTSTPTPIPTSTPTPIPTSTPQSPPDPVEPPIPGCPECYPGPDPENTPTPTPTPTPVSPPPDPVNPPAPACPTCGPGADPP